MRIALLMKIVQSSHHLMKVGPGHSLREGACFSHEVEEFSPADVLEDDGEAVVRGFIFLFVEGVFTYADQLDQILMIQYFHDGELVLEGFEGCGLLLVFLDGD